MKNKNKVLDIFVKVLSYLLVAAVAVCITLFVCLGSRNNKLNQLQMLIENCFIGEVDETALLDAAADAMVKATGDKWSYYIPASEYAAHMEQMNNAYVGIGVTISGFMGQSGIEILQVDPTGGAYEAGILAGDVITKIDGKSILEIGVDGSKDVIRGEENTTVSITVLRGNEELTFSVIRKTIKVTVSKGQMLEGNVGLIRIANFDARCAEETLAAIKSLVEQGAESLIFDVRYNPGGYKDELVKVLDYLLPEGKIFHSIDYTGREEITKSDSACLEMPMAVLVNGSSYSAAEFFAAALGEYEWAVVVGEQTSGKSYFQNTIVLSDGSAVGLSMGKYFTPNGVSLAEVGGLTPDVLVTVDADTAAKIYAETLQPEEDPQLQAALQELKK
ncbi:MAG: PDZ domain-containing protein [Oscillospiraceae bacterium]|nr:PDZ domain-containing protein [Oscillospiraceae bacterium]